MYKRQVDIGREQLAKFGIGNQQTANVNVPSDVQNVSYDPSKDMMNQYYGDGSINSNVMRAGGVDGIDLPNIGTDLGTGTGPFDSYVQQGLDRVTPLPKEGFFESLGYEGSRANLNPFNIVKNILQNPTPNDIENMMNYQRLVKGGMNESVALETIQNLYKLTPAKASAIAGAVTYGTQLVMDKMGGGDDDEDDGSSAGYEINPILDGIFSGGSSGDIYYDYPSAIQAAEGGIMDLQNGGESKGPGTGTSDSIPAMLSDGEFVMTARAVRGAGGGDRREGARKMYEMMDNLERSA